MIWRDSIPPKHRKLAAEESLPVKQGEGRQGKFMQQNREMKQRVASHLAHIP